MTRIALGIIAAAGIGVGHAGGVPSDVAQIRALRLANNRAIARHDIAGMRAAWASDIHLVCCDNALYSGAPALMASYQQEELKDPAFVAYVRIPERITVSADGTRAAEDGKWVGVFKRPHPVSSGRYFASWQKERGGWKIASESYVPLSADERGVAALHPVALDVGGTPDWLAVTPGAVWVANDALHAVQRISPMGEKVEAAVSVAGEPCSGLTYAFGSVWAPICGAHPGLARIDPARNAVSQFLPVPPALSEGGITASPDSIWLVTREGVLARIDPDRNRIRQTIAIPTGAYNPLYSDGVVWVTSGTTDSVIAVDARSGEVVARVPTGSQPRFLTAGGGMLWTLDQGDGTIARIDMRRKALIELIAADLPGGGGDITYGAGAVWATIIGVPLTRLGVACHDVAQWLGRGGDAIRVGDDAIWLTDYHNGRIFRIAQDAVGGACNPGAGG